MKRYLIVFFLLCCFTITKVQAQADQRTLTTKIADLLAKVPFQDTAQAEKNMEAMAGMGETGLQEMATQLAAPGKGDNTALEYALNGYSYYTTKPGKEALKKSTESAYISALEKTTDKENKAFLIRQLQTTGSDAAVASLKNYLSDERLCDPAARALVKINTPAAGKALLTALTTASGNNQLTLTEALGDIRYREAAPLIATYTTNSDKKLVKVALYALAYIAEPASETALANAAAKAGFSYDITDASAAYIKYAEQLAAAGKAPQAKKIAASLLKKTPDDNQVPFRTAALKLLTSIDGEKSLPVLISATNDKNAKYREAVLKYAGAYTGDAAITQWIKQLGKADNTVKAEIIDFLGKAGNRIALPVVVPALQNPDGNIKTAAIKAAALIGQQEALPALLKMLNSSDAGEAGIITLSILSMKGPDVTNQLAAALPTTSSASGKAAIINILAARAADAKINDVLPLLKNDDAIVSTAAFASLKSLAKQDNLPQLFSLLTSAANPGEIKATQDAIVAATRSIPDTAQRVALITAKMKEVPGKEHLFFSILSGIGGKNALTAVSDGFATGNDQAKTQAVTALSNWPDVHAAASLLQISRQAGNNNYSESSLNGYIGLVSRSSYPADQKLLMLRDAMAIAKTTRQKQLILNETGRCKTYPALLFAGNYLEDPAIQHEAASAVMDIALSNKSWYGAGVRSLLEKASGLLAGPDASYERQAIQKHLAELPTGESFVPLFNEKDLTGWKGLVGNPILRAKMDAKKQAKEQQKADEIMRKGWSVINGELVFGGSGENLCTIKKYSDFEMFVDWKILKDGDAGIYLRGTPQVQIWDTSRRDAGAEVGSGGLYNNATHPNKPLKLADNAIGEWNSFHIIMKGDRVTVYLNGELVVDNTILENYWDRNLPIFSEEQIELQAHGNQVAYRDLFIREIPPAKPFTLSEEEKKEGFKVLFDGTNMYNWTGNTTDYVLEDGVIAVYPKDGGHGNLYTKEEYSDFVYRFEFQLTPGANNGIGIRAPLEGDAAYEGMEIQVLDNEAAIYKNLHEYQYHGSVYGVIPAKRGFLKPTGEWNTEEITAKGNRIKVILNGTVILDGDIAEASKNGTRDGKEHPGLKRTTGHIGFLGHGDQVKFRNIRIK
ncbi:MAG: hypothetical protein JWM28_3176 [Chitinophagaceae bacterium]|nr:hypothetical protein [Chitinophagaceae bacterium]